MIFENDSVAADKQSVDFSLMNRRRFLEIAGAAFASAMLFPKAAFAEIRDMEAIYHEGNVSDLLNGEFHWDSYVFYANVYVSGITQNEADLLRTEAIEILRGSSLVFRKYGDEI